MPPTDFRGNDLKAWIIHFGFSEKLSSTLTSDLDVKNVDDLKYVFEDQEMLDILSAQVTRIEYKKFLEAKALTNPPLLPPTPPMARAVVSATSITSSASHSLPVARAAPSGIAGTGAVVSPPLPPPSASRSLSRTTAEVEALEKRLRDMEQKLRDAEMQKTATAEAHITATVERRLREGREAEQKARDMVNKKIAIDNLSIKIRHAASLDLAFMVDCTGSMLPYLEAVKANITKLVVDIQRLHPYISLRIAFIGYRDHCDGDQRLVVERFTNDVSKFTAIVSAQKPVGGGGDGPEDVFGGLQLVRTLDWVSQTRMLYHIGDYPCHGLVYHDNTMGDDHPSGDPNGLTALDLLTDINRKQIKYCFGKITNYTDIMIAKFNEILAPSSITTTPVTNLNLIDVVTKTTTAAMTDSISASGRTEDGKIAQRTVVLDPTVPHWLSIPTEGAMKFPMTMPTSFEALAAEVDDRCVTDFPESVVVQVKVAPRAFAKGAMRAAHHGQVVVGSRTVGAVFKESLAMHKKFRTKLDYEKFLVCHRAAKFLAKEFNKVKPRDCPSIDYVEAHILQLMARYPEQPFVICEGQIPGTFEKFNSNTGYCAPSPSAGGFNHDAVQAFSHWTHCVTKGKLMVVDCQGGFDQRTNTFLLTDPAVHSTSMLQFGGTNLSEKGFGLFFASHVCNGHCAAMRLPAAPSGTTSGK